MPLCTQVEAELQDLEAAEAQEYLQSLGVQEGGLRSLIAATYKQLGLLTYFTTGVQLSSGGLVKTTQSGLLRHFVSCVVISLHTPPTLAWMVHAMLDD